MHVAVAELDYREQGHVSYLLPHLLGSTFNLDPRFRRVMFDPDHRNVLARKFCERGAACLGEHDMSNRRMALYALVRTPDDVPGLPEASIDGLHDAVLKGIAGQRTDVNSRQ